MVQWLRLLLMWRVPFQSLIRELESTCFVAQKKKNSNKKQNVNNRSNIEANSIKTLKMVHIKKNLKKYCLYPVEGLSLSMSFLLLMKWAIAKEKVGARISQPLTTCPRFLPVSATELPPPGPNSSLFMWELLFFLRKCHLSS